MRNGNEDHKAEYRKPNTEWVPVNSSAWRDSHLSDKRKSGIWQRVTCIEMRKGLGGRPDPVSSPRSTAGWQATASAQPSSDTSPPLPLKCEDVEVVRLMFPLPG